MTGTLLFDYKGTYKPIDLDNSDDLDIRIPCACGEVWNLYTVGTPVKCPKCNRVYLAHTSVEIDESHVGEEELK